jgi:PAS domain S-box-containing protein
MIESPLKIVLVESNAADAHFLTEMLHKEISANIEVMRAESMGDAERHLVKLGVDIIVLDLGLPDAQGLEAVRRARAAAPHIPMVVLTELDDVSLALRALQEGAQDYFVKGRIEPTTLYRAMRYAIERKNMEKELLGAKDRAEQAEALLRDAVDSMSEGFVSALKQAQEALRRSEWRLDSAQKIAGIGSWNLDLGTRRHGWSKEMYRIHGVSPENFQPDMTNLAAHAHPDDDTSVRRWFADLMEGSEQTACETRIVRPDGEVRLLHLDGREVANPDGVSRSFAGTMQDITERRQIERQLAQAQKMEAIGNLTGGMAHDFNNGLGIIIGNLDLLGQLLKADRAATELCDDARDGALRCADLIRQLLAFARQQPLRPRQTDVNALVEGAATLLRSTLGENITLSLRLATRLCAIVADPEQLQVALVNFANNARDAMPKGGHLDITTRTMELDAHYAALHPDVAPGTYVAIAVRDSGIGIAPDIIGNIFEPFFTTKGPGQGTGLGLSMAFGFVKQSGGHLTVYSEPGRGSTFCIYLPCARDAGIEAAAAADREPVVGGNETVLVVEDNARLRNAAVRQLEELGYRVREAENAAAALAILATADRADLLFTDVVMPGAMDGIDLAHQALRLRPAMKVLLTSGFPGTCGADQSTTSYAFPLLGKPYRHNELARMVREVLDQGKERAPDTAACLATGPNQSLHDGNPAVAATQV